MEILHISKEVYNNDDVINYSYTDSAEEPAVIEALSKRLEAELKEAKNTHLTVGEVLLPNGLTRRIAQDIIGVADNEPCGIRGCTLYINFDGDGGFNKRLCMFKCDPSTTSTFEVHLTLKQSTAGWSNILPQFLKKITRGSAVMISSEYQLVLKKLYRSSLY